MAKDNWKSLRSAGNWGNGLANGLTLLTTNWGAVVAVVIALGAGLVGAARELLLQPAVWVSAGVFLVILWTWIGILVLRDRNKPKFVRSYQDYAYGLTYEALIPVYDAESTDGTLQFGVQLRNYSPGPIKYTVTKLDLMVGDRALPKLKKGIDGYLARGAARMSHNVPFKKESLQDVFKKRVTGSAEIEIVYGHPEAPPVRCLRISLEIILGLNEGPPPTIAYGGTILEEVDGPI